jgi:UDP-glucuronate 4-epimerase
MVGEVFDRKPRIRSLSMQPGDVERADANVTKGQELLGYRPSTELSDEMRVFTFWYEMQVVTWNGVKSR